MNKPEIIIGLLICILMLSIIFLVNLTYQNKEISRELEFEKKLRIAFQDSHYECNLNGHKMVDYVKQYCECDFDQLPCEWS